MMNILKSILILTFIVGCSPKSEDVVVIGSKMDTEGTILGYIQLLALEDAGLKVEDRIETGPTLIVRQALLSGEIDGYIEYTGTALVNFMKVDDREILSDARKAYQTVAKWDGTNHNIRWLKAWSGINNTYTVLMKQSEAQTRDINSISTLAGFVKKGNQIRFGSDHEFSARPDGLNSMLEAYGLLNSQNLQIVNMDAGLVYQTLNQSSVDAAIGYSTDGRIAAFNLIRLEDDRNFFPVYNPTPTYRIETLQRFPQVERVLNRIASTITAGDITEMNYRNDVKLERPKFLAREWLVKNGIIQNSNQM
jgi:osmoprotectant transport system substrate-binding protein